MGKSEQQEINELRVRVRELEKTVSSQNKLIEIFKSMPGQRIREHKEDAALANGVPRGVPKKNRVVAQNRGPKGKPEDNSKSSGGRPSNGEVLEESAT